MDTNLDKDIFGAGRITDNAKEAVVAAYNIAEELNNNEVLPVHLFLAIIKNPQNILQKMFDEGTLDLDLTYSEISQRLKSEKVTSGLPKFSAEIKALINDAFLIAAKLSHVYVGTEHLFLAILKIKGAQFVQELEIHNVTYQNLVDLMQKFGNYLPGILSKTSKNDEYSYNPEEEGFSQNADRDGLPFFCKDMNKAAMEGEYLPITGRDIEIDRLVHILARKTKNNPILVGDAGVGKTAIVQGFVQRLISGNVPPSFVGKKVVNLDVAAIIAGSRVRGDVEERILNFVTDVINSGDKIVFIDEIHMIVGAGGSGRDSMDIANILKPHLTNPDLRVIGATTSEEYSRYFEDDPALSRRFQQIEVEEIDSQSALEILQILKPEFEHYHGIKIKNEALVAAIDLSDRFILNRYLPDKAIDVIDEAAASLKINRELKLEPELSRLGEKLLSVQKDKQTALESGELSQASKYYDLEQKVTDQIAEVMEGKTDRKKVVDEKTVRKVIVNWTKIPLAAGEVDNKKLAELGKKINKRIMGQDKAVEAVVSTLRRSHLDINNSHRPLASVLFLGPTGVGKTELARSIAAELFGDEDLLIQYNMSEFMEMHSVSKLIGAPPGYVGYQQGGQLTEEIRRSPYAVVLFDEIEKAHPDVLNLLLQILEEGELKDGRGRKAYFKNTVVILTSNIGAEEVSKHSRLGFNVDLESVPQQEVDNAFETMRDSLLEQLRKNVRPEILNRLDEIIVFRGLNKEDSLGITQKFIEDLIESLTRLNIQLKVEHAVVKHINEVGYSKEYGARNIRRAVQTNLENGLAEFLLSQKGLPKKGMKEISANLKKDKVTFKYHR